MRTEECKAFYLLTHLLTYLYICGAGSEDWKQNDLELGYDELVSGHLD